MVAVAAETAQMILRRVQPEQMLQMQLMGIICQIPKLESGLVCSIQIVQVHYRQNIQRAKFKPDIHWIG